MVYTDFRQSRFARVCDAARRDCQRRVGLTRAGRSTSASTAGHGRDAAPIDVDHPDAHAAEFRAVGLNADDRVRWPCYLWGTASFTNGVMGVVSARLVILE